MLPLQVAAGALKTVCSACGGSQLVTQSAKEATQLLQMFHNIARFHGFDLLAELCDWLLEQPSSRT